MPRIPHPAPGIEQRIIGVERNQRLVVADSFNVFLCGETCSGGQHAAGRQKRSNRDLYTKFSKPMQTVCQSVAMSVPVGLACLPRLLLFARTIFAILGLHHRMGERNDASSS